MFTNTKWFLLLLLSFQAVAFGARTKSTEQAKLRMRELSFRSDSSVYKLAVSTARKLQREELAYKVFNEAAKAQAILWKMVDEENIQWFDRLDPSKIACMVATKKKKPVVFTGVEGAHHYRVGRSAVSQKIKTDKIIFDQEGKIIGSTIFSIETIVDNGMGVNTTFINVQPRSKK